MDNLRQDYKYAHISAATTTVIGVSNCTLVALTVNTTANGAITIYDNVGTATTNIVGVLKASIAEGTYRYGIRLAQGLKIVTAGASDVTVVYSTN